MKIFSTIIFCFLFACTGFAQGSFAWGVKGGPTVGFQQWNSFQRDPLYRYHGDLYIESYDGEGANALYAQIGYHVKGSALRNRNGRGVNGQVFQLATRTFEFNNISLATGFKQLFDLNANKAYYFFGLRGDYTLSTNLQPFDRNNIESAYFPIKEGVRRFNYGISGGAGIEFMFADLVGGVIEFSLAPDISFQYQQQEVVGSLVTDPFTGQPTTLPERRIRNFVAEVSVGFRFLRIVEYID